MHPGVTHYYCPRCGNSGRDYFNNRCSCLIGNGHHAMPGEYDSPYTRNVEVWKDALKDKLKPIVKFRIK